MPSRLYPPRKRITGRSTPTGSSSHNPRRFAPSTAWVVRRVLLVSALGALVALVLWMIAAVTFLWGMDHQNDENSSSIQDSSARTEDKGGWLQKPPPPVQLLSVPHQTIPTSIDETPREISCQATTDVRGNLGPASILLQNGTDWIRDRWQAASDMHGTNIHGIHWAQLDWSSSSNVDKDKHPQEQQQRQPQPIVICNVVLDWEAAFAKDYELQIRRPGNEEWTTIFQSPNPAIQITKLGQSPGVKTKTPLHVVHTIPVLPDCDTARNDINQTTSSFRINILKSATGWGVSLWQIQVYGYYIE